MGKKKSKEKNIKLFCPESFSDIEDIVELLQEKESSMLVNMTKCKLKKEGITKIMNFIEEGQTSYMIIKVKKFFPKVFVCWSEKNELFI